MKVLLKRLTNFLRQPYPFYYQGKDVMVILMLIFGIALLFNYLVEPFHVNRDEHRFGYFWISVIHSLVPLVVLLILVALLSLFGKTVLSETWDIRKEIVFLVLLLLLTGIGQFLIRDIIYDNPLNWSWQYLFEEIRNTFIVGTFILFILVPLNFNRLYLKHQKWAASAEGMPKTLNGPVPGPKATPIFIKTQVKSDDFELEPHSLVYAKSDKNYLEIFLKQGEAVQKHIKRMTIKHLDSQLSNCPFIFKTHRSYLVNLQQVRKVEGNAQGYRLRLKDVGDVLPVSRAMIAGFEQQFPRRM